MSIEKRQNFLPPEETAMFCEQVALILKSGIPLFDGMETLCENFQATRYADKFRALADVVRQTGSLYDGLEAVGIFPPYLVNSVRISERAGTSDVMMAKLAEHYTREGQTQRAIRNAITYPLVLVVIMAVVIVVLVTQALPIFTEVFRNLGTEMSASSTSIMNFGMAAGQTVLVLIAVALAIGAVLFVLLKTKRREAVLAFIGKVVPSIALIRDKTAASSFASIMSMMMSSGFPLEEAIAMIPDVLTGGIAKRKVEMCCEKMIGGESFASAVESCDIFDGLHSKMIRIGFMTGATDDVMSRLTAIYDEEVDDSIRKLVSWIEPLLVAILSIVVGAILLSVILPLVSIMSAL